MRSLNSKLPLQIESPVDPVLTRAQLCALANVSEDTLRREVRAGKLKMLRLGSPRRLSSIGSRALARRLCGLG